MIPENIKKLITALLQKTNAKEAIWGKTSRDNEFKLIFENGAVTTDQWDTSIDFAIYNKLGDRIDAYYYNSGGEDFDLLMQLHSAAKRNFYKVEDTVNGLFEELNSPKKIGKQELEKPEEDLPF